MCAPRKITDWRSLNSSPGWSKLERLVLVLLVGGRYFASFDALMIPAVLEDLGRVDDAVDHGSGHGEMTGALCLHARRLHDVSV